MSLSSHNWFKYINEVRLNEGVRDIGLPEAIIDRIEATLPEAAEKAKTWVGNHWKIQQTGDLANKKQLLFVNIVGDLIKSGVFDGTENATDVQEGDSENLKKAKYQIENLKNILLDPELPLGRYNRAFKKILRNLSESGVDSEVVEGIKEGLDDFLRDTYEIKLYGRYPSLFAMLNMDTTYYEEIKDFSVESYKSKDMSPRAVYNGLRDANQRASEILEGIEDPEQVFMQFEDGSYWYDLQVYNCPLEGSRMGHCGGDDRASTLYSLRKWDKNQKESRSYVTVSYDADNDIIYQIKGRANSAPPEATWPAIAELIKELGVRKVAENGEHSEDIEGFLQMNAYLDENTAADVSDVSSAWDEMEEALDNVIANSDMDTDGLEYTPLVSDYGYNMPDRDFLMDNGDDPYYEAYAVVSLEIDLGWPDIETSQDFYRSPKFAPIPEDSWGTPAARDFLDASGLDSIREEIPSIGYSEYGETDYRVEMLEGVSGEITAHLVVTINVTTDRSQDVGDFKYFVSQLEQLNEESNVQEVIARVRAELIRGGYAAPNAWEASKRSLLDLEESGDLKNFVIVDDASSLDFIFRDPETGDMLPKSELRIPTTLLPYVRFPNDTKYFDKGAGAHLELAKEMFKGELSRSKRYHIDSPTLNSQMYAQLNFLYRQFQRDQQNPRQQELPFGAKYKRKETALPQDVQVRLSVKPMEGKHTNDLSFYYTFAILVNSRSSQEAIDQTIEFLKVLDKNPQFVTAAVEEILDVNANVVIHNAQLLQRDYNESTGYFNQLYNDLMIEHEAAAKQGDARAEAIVLMITWFRDNFSAMSAAEKYVTFHRYLEPLRFPELRPAEYNRIMTDAETFPASDGPRKPVRFDTHTRAHIRAIGGHAPEISEGIDSLTKSMRRVRMDESIESRVERIDNLLNEADPTYDLRIYKITVGCNVSDVIGGSEAETAAEIRGVEGVTTVRPVADYKKRITAQNEYIPFEIKFELLGSASRVKYRDEILFPAMRRIKGLSMVDWTSIHRTNIQGTVRTVRESYGDGMGGFGGLGGGLAAAQMGSGPSSPRVTPTPTIDDLIGDWSEGGVQMYDHPTDTTNMAYHVMMPVEELWPYCSTHYRGDQISFDGNYEDFIANGAQSPVYLAIGKNGRAKVTGNEDIVWFAKKSGLEEVPVFISYQRQV